ncbi:hypothetical protein LTR36_006496 [Oleoguttula mirabilis]|uniref:Flavoprotein domain-containing protein n=1 Tax=Oleoguttula mirabilis TaxID=1507867 RepID=A0AAV9JV75_9PEZI|nr:hypothetical protein LTR36_006496 [Oleoguttula mirabilis]
MAASASSSRRVSLRVASSRNSGMRIAVPDIDGSSERNPRELNVLFASTGCTDAKIIDDLLPRLADMHNVALRSVLDPGFRGQDLIQASSYCLTVPNMARGSSVDNADVEQEAAELCEWANLLVLGPIDANTLAKMLHGHTDNLLLEILRSWNVSKKILLVPGMSSLTWENPMTKKQLTKIRRKWNWIQVLHPILWGFEEGKKKIVSWESTDELVDAVRNQVDLMNIGHGMNVSPSSRAPAIRRASADGSANSPISLLPAELWTMIFDFTGDWELAQTLHIYTNLPPPADWQSHISSQGPRNYMEALELTILRGNLTSVKHFIATHSVPRWLSKLCIKLIMRFAMTPLLAHLEANHKDLFWATFGHTFLPDKASSVFGRTEILEFWRTSPSFLTKEYNTEALDGASRSGFVNVLEWWQHSGLPLKFTESALEQASSQGHLPILEWWKTQSTAVDHTSATASVDSSKIRLKPGKSICYATQNGHTAIVRWWCHSGIPFPHEDAVAKLASTHGHVDILQLWHELKGSKMIFDNQVLVGATKSGHVGVLEWWRRSGLKVEYKTCDVEEALEDGDEGQRGMEVRRWWARNGLNLGVGTSEWMKTKYLNS